jgi:8-amino-7-oxononanoate synthase
MTEKNNPYSWLEKSLNTIHKANWYRTTKTIQSLPGAVINLEGKSLVNFASNDYLGLAEDPRLIHASIEAIKNYGTGTTGSRLLSGHRELHQQLEQEIASLKNTEDALVFSSGYLANLGTISAIVGNKDLILADEYNHSSLKNGAKLSGAKIIEYSHCNYQDLNQKLEQNREQYKRCLIVTDSVFSMDGDLAPLPQLIGTANEYNSMLLIDEAHATGVMGENGAGSVEYFNCNNGNLIQIGTLSKAIGSLGGYVAGSRNLIDFLRNRCATWIYTTGLSPADTAAALAGINIIKNQPLLRQNLWYNVNLFKQELAQLNLNLLPSESPIICLALDSAKSALILADKLRDAGFFAPAIRPPTVPISRIRFSLMTTHKPEHIYQLIEFLKSGINQLLI